MFSKGKKKLFIKAEGEIERKLKEISKATIKNQTEIKYYNNAIKQNKT